MAENLGSPSRVLRPAVFVTEEQFADLAERVDVIAVGLVNLIESVLELQEAVFEAEDEAEDAEEHQEEAPETQDEHAGPAVPEHEEPAHAPTPEELIEEFAAANEPEVPEAIDPVEAANSVSGIPEEGITVSPARDDDDIS